MRYRQFLHDGKPTDRVDAAEADFGVSDEVGIAEVAAKLGVPPEEITVVYPRTPEVAAVTIPPDEAPAEPRPRLEALFDAIESASTLADLKTAVRQIRR